MLIGDLGVTVEGLLVTLSIGVVGFIMLWLSNAATLQKRINELTTKIFELQNQLMILGKREADCQVENTKLTAEIQSSLKRIQKLETATGIKDVPVVGVVVADLKGFIKVFSPTLVQLFRWLPEELRGKHISILMGEGARQAHNKEFDAFVNDNDRRLDPNKVILTEGRDKYGNPVKLAITLDGFQIGAEGLITATIRDRAVVTDTSNPVTPSGFPRQ